MTKLVNLYLTENTSDSPHPTEIPLVENMDEAAAVLVCLGLNEGGYLREGIEAHYVTSEPA